MVGSNLDKGKVKKKKIKISPKTDYFCQEGIKYFDWKDITAARKFINKQGRIVPRKYSQLIPKNHRRATKIIKRLRQMALLPYVIVEQSEEPPK